MKLSDLETLVKAMRDRATSTNIADPDVKFYESSRTELLKALERGDIFLSLDIRSDVEGELSEHVACCTNSSTEKGDFAIPLDVK